MSLKTFVKVGGVSNLSDARYSAGMGVDILGFSFDPADAHHVLLDQYIAITEWISGVQFAAEFSQCTAEEMEEQLALYGRADYLQLSNHHYIELLRHLQLPIILQLELSRFQDLASLVDVMQQTHTKVAYFLLENDSPADISSWLDDAIRLAEQYPVLLGFGITAENVPVLVEQTQLKGIALKGSEELKPGYKSYDELADILETIETDD